MAAPTIPRGRRASSPTRTVLLGRESGDWVFPYDQHGVALAVRGERAVRKGQRILLGDQVLRIESVE